ncbi:related to ribokinase [Lecanosticta acicola]|uniref:Ribokinase n=1 Tax=Lecanosticta acicola TaxID=111012 RepID=A0AAI9EAJ8_9PEZI|nr:related to ribokinase [Lecanosticta acicola]
MAEITRNQKKKIVSVIGSLNIDFITRTLRIPEAGETFAARSFDTGFGGKGANQAVAAARLAGEDVSVRMMGQVGDDGFGNDYFEALGREGIESSGVRELKGQKTGVTNIIVEEASGENRILFVANANDAYPEEYGPDWDLLVAEEEGGGGEVVVFQLEIPMEVVLHNMRKAREAGKHVILNPAPAAPLPESAFEQIDTLVMNESETAILAGPQHQPKDQSNETLIALAKKFLSWGVRDAVVITLGEKGLVYATSSGSEGHLNAYKAKVVDTTAAGDTFVGGYAVQRVRNLASGFDYTQALQFATLAASKTVEKEGAMAAIPYLRQLQVGAITDKRTIAAAESKK